MAILVYENYKICPKYDEIQYIQTIMQQTDEFQSLKVHMEELKTEVLNIGNQ